MFAEIVLQIRDGSFSWNVPVLSECNGPAEFVAKDQILNKISISASKVCMCAFV